MPTPPSVDNYALGKGKLYIAEFSSGTPGAYTALGNAPSIELEFNIERLPHYSSQTGFKTKDKNPIILTEYTLNFVLDEIAAENLKYFLMATQSGSDLLAYQNVDSEFALKFVADNPLGSNRIWQFWKGTISPNGAMQLIGEEWMQLSFRFEGLSDVANHATSPYITVQSSSSSRSSSSSSSSSSSAST